MDIKVNQTTPVTQIEQTQANKPTDGTFKFTLASAIEESELAERLSNLMGEITEQGEKIIKRRDIQDMRRYRSLIKDFMNEVVNRSHKFSRENFLDRRGRHRVYGMVRLVDEKLDQIASELLSGLFTVSSGDYLTEIDESSVILVKQVDTPDSYQQLATYVIRSSQPGEVTGEVTIALNSGTLGTLTSGKTDYSVTKDGVTVTYSKGSSQNQYISDSQIRLYAGNTITISANGFITDVEFTKVGGKGDKVLEASEGTVSDMSWSGLAPSIVFNTNRGRGHIQFSSVKVSIAIESQKLQGDVNGDGQVTLEDIRAVIHSIVGLSQNGETDVNGDGRVDIGDILAIIAIR